MILTGSTNYRHAGSAAELVQGRIPGDALIQGRCPWTIEIELLRSLLGLVIFALSIGCLSSWRLPTISASSWRVRSLASSPSRPYPTPPQPTSSSLCYSAMLSRRQAGTLSYAYAPCGRAERMLSTCPTGCRSCYRSARALGLYLAPNYHLDPAPGPFHPIAFLTLDLCWRAFMATLGAFGFFDPPSLAEPGVDDARAVFMWVYLIAVVLFSTCRRHVLRLVLDHLEEFRRDSIRTSVWQQRDPP